MAVAFQATAQGEDEEMGPDYNRPGLVIGGGSSLVHELFADGSGSDFDAAYGGHFHVGYRSNRFVATEFFIEHTADESSGPSKGKGRIITVMPGLRLYPLGFLEWRIQPVVLVNLGFMFVRLPDSKAQGFATRAGGGIEAYVTEHVIVDFAATYIDAASKVRGTNHLSFSLGVSYKF